MTLEDFKTNTDSVRSFIKDSSYYIIDGKTPLKEVYESYCQYCTNDNLNKVSKKTFSQRIVEVYIKKVKIQKRVVSNARFLNIKNNSTY
jgi:phage/plasmid-associated DNA primase